MDKELKILHLEYIAADAELITKELKKAKISFDMRVVDNKVDYIKALNEFKPDLVLSAHFTPVFDSMEALRALKHLYPNIPFILVTSSVSEEFVINIINEGAADYVLKDRIQRLPLALKKVMEKFDLETEQIKHLKELIINEAFLMEAENIAKIGSLEVRLKNGNSKWSSGLYVILGYQMGEIEPSIESLIKFIHPEDLPFVQYEIDTALANCSSAMLNFRINSKAGQTKYIYGKIIIHTNRKGEPTYLKAVVQDVTERTDSEKKINDVIQELKTQTSIKESESRFRLALEKIGDNVWEHDFRNNETVFSNSNKDFFGYSTVELTANPEILLGIVYKEDLSLLEENDLNYKKGLIDSHSLEYRIIHKNGTLKWALDRGVTIEKDQSGKSMRIIGTHADISHIKQTETELEQRVKQFKSLSENIPGVIYEYEFRPDGTERLRYISPAIKQVFGIDPADFHNYLNYIHPDDRERILKKNQKSKITLDPFYDESRLIIPGFGERWHSVHSSFSYISQSGAKVFTGFMMDITERKNAEETLRANEERYRSIIATMKLGLLEIDNNENITFVNQSFCNMSGFSLQELLGNRVSDLLISSEIREILSSKQKKSENGIFDAYEINVKNKTGKNKWWLISSAPRYNDNGHLAGSIGICLDITGQKKLEHDLTLAKKNAEHLAKTKETFLANMSHEIRTPMNAIMGMANQLAKSSLNSQQQFYLEIIQSASDNLLVIINDILDLSKIEAGKLILENIGFETKLVGTRAIQVLAYKAEEKGIKLTSSRFDAAISPILIGDPHRLNQILLNLMSNAIKFTENGFVDLSFDLIEDNANHQTIKVSVQDTGVGMEQGFIDQIFDKFSQEYESVSRNYGGTGLGMSICKELIELMGGSISVESEKGVGTTISIILKAPKGSLIDLPEKFTLKFDKKFLSGKRILIVDDNEMNRLVASVFLENHDASIIHASNGQQAIDEFILGNPDVILMDIQMPGINGFDATRAIRKLDDKIPIIALTANAIIGESEKCLAAGMNDYVSKPFKEEDLLKTIAKWLGKEVNIIKMEDTEKPNENLLYDLSSLRSISGGNEAFVEKLVNIFCEQTPPLIREMTDAFYLSDYEKMGAIAHKIKPSIDNLNIVDLKEPIRYIENMGRQPSMDTDMTDILNEAERVISKVVEMMKTEFSTK
ncbi:PAS domain S-box protein [Mucilaginibacter sp. FT3.2]|uniref:PAS domain S-box protein n=1 Tax=Mucilaginibacter sp. FT3.2 TaxID=2723090 RepID=UPI001613EFD8|nr:PAS domain S-box protein [Mucilaginibacter sp. FT3.2]MBB6233641.1 PAS domain S-box-containing protein [Mucilaginibacter sp. FT3.2]